MNLNPLELAARREALGLSQHGLGKWLGVPQNTVAQWERGKRPIRTHLATSIAAAERLIDELTRTAVADLKADDDAGTTRVLHTYGSEAELWAAIPALHGTPAAFHRVAMARAQWQATNADNSLDIRIEPAAPPSET